MGQRPWHSPEKIYRLHTSIWTADPHQVLSGKCKLKQQWGVITYLLEWPNSRKMTTPNADTDVEQQEHSFIVGENAKGLSPFKRQLGGFLTNLDILLPCNPTIMLLDIFIQKNWKLMTTQKPAHRFSWQLYS